MPAYKAFSFEELRLQDYAAGRKTAAGAGGRGTLIVRFGWLGSGGWGWGCPAEDVLVWVGRGPERNDTDMTLGGRPAAACGGALNPFPFAVVFPLVFAPVPA